MPKVQAKSRNSHHIKSIGAPTQDDVWHTRTALAAIQPVLNVLSTNLRRNPPYAAITATAFVGVAILNDLAGRRSTLKNITATGRNLPHKLLKEWGLTGTESYRQYTHFFSRMSDLLRSDEELHGHLEQFFDSDEPDDGTIRVNAVSLFATACLQGQLAEAFGGLDFNENSAFDGTVIKTTARTAYRDPTEEEKKLRTKADRDKQVRYAPADPDAKNGHYPAKGGDPAGFAVGYEFHLALPILDGPSPMVASAMAIEPNHTGHRVAMRNLSIRLADRIDHVIYDAGYHFTDERTFTNLADFGISRTFDPNNGPPRKGNVTSGALVLDGDCFCPETPVKLQLPERSNDPNKTNKFDQRHAYMFERHGTDDTRLRFMCPAAAGKVYCPRYTPAPAQAAKTRDPKKPTVQPKQISKDAMPACCTQKTISVPRSLVAQTRQDRAPYGTSDWEKLYGQRAKIEAVNAAIRSNNNGGIAETKWTAVMGREKTGLMFLFKTLASNIVELDRYVIEPPPDD